MSIIETLQENSELSLGKFNIIEYARTYLWRDMALWFSAYLTSIYGDPSYKDAVFQKWYSIPMNFYNILTIIFGAANAEKYTTLLSKYITLMSSLIAAMANMIRMLQLRIL